MTISRAQLTPRPGRLGATSLAELPARLASSNGSVLFYAGYGERPSEVSHAELSGRVYAAIRFFRDRGVRSGSRVLLPFETHLPAIVSFLALSAMGALPCSIRPLASRSGAPEFTAFLQRLHRRFEPQFILDVPCLEPLDVPLPRLALPPPETAAALPCEVALDAPAFVQFSSGSTSFPKGVPISHENLAKNLGYIRYFVEQCVGVVRDDECASSWLPLYHDMGLIGGFLSPLWSGLTVHLAAPQTFLLQPLEWLTHLTETKAAYSAIPHFAVSYLLRLLADTDEDERAQWDLSHVKVIFNGSEPIRARELEALAQALAPSGFRSSMLQPSYGMAEAALLVTCANHTKPRQERLANGQACVSVGKPHPEFELRVVNEAGTDCGERELGQVLLRGGSLAPGYFLNSPRLFDEQGFYPTGDLGFLVDGELFVTGRISDRIKINGQSLFAADFEAAVDALSFVGPGRSVAFQTDTDVFVLVSVPARNASERRAAIRQALLASLAVTIPVECIRFVRPSALKKTSSGKLKRNEIRADFCNGLLAE